MELPSTLRFQLNQGALESNCKGLTANMRNYLTDKVKVGFKIPAAYGHIEFIIECLPLWDSETNYFMPVFILVQ